jgi:hypothetical protein
MQQKQDGCTRLCLSSPSVAYVNEGRVPKLLRKIEWAAIIMKDILEVRFS